MAEKINVGKFINNLDAEDLSSEKLQGVVNNVYAKAIKDHKQTADIADDNLKDLEKETVEFVKSNHDRLKANKETPDKELNENYSVVDLSSGERFGNYDSVESARVKALQYYRLGLAEGRLAIVDDNLNPIGWVSPQGKLNKSIEENKHSTTKIVESFERALKPGDKIIVRGTEVTIGNIIDQYYDKDYIDIEFEDDKGNYRSWKSDIDGGKVIYKESKVTEDVDKVEWHNLDEMTKEEIYDDLWTAACVGDNNRVKQIFSGSYVKPNEFRLDKFGGKHSLIMGALRNRNFDTADVLKSFGEKILKSEVEEYKGIMAQRTYRDEVTDGALDEAQIVLSDNDLKRKVNKAKKYFI